MGRIAVAVVVLTLAAAGKARSQEPADTVWLKEIVVTATRLPVARSALPIATSVVTGEELASRGLRTVADALRALPGVAVVAPGSHGGVTSLFLRGGNSGYVKVLVDGVPVNSPGGTYDFANLPAEDVERIEVVRGPASVLYGSDAVTGVIQVFTRRGRGPAHAMASFSDGRGRRAPTSGDGEATPPDGTLAAGEAAASGAPAARGKGAYNVADWSAQASGGSSRAGWSAAASRFTSGGLYRFNNSFANTTVGGRLELRPDDSSDAALSVRRTANDFHFPTDDSGNPVDLNSATKTEQWALALEGGRRWGRVDSRVLLGTARTIRADLDPRDGSADTLGLFASEGHTHDGRNTADAHLDWRAGRTTVLTAGATVERESEDRHNWYSSQWGDGRDSADVARTARGYYAQAFAAPASHLSLTGGARLDDNSRFGRFTTWRAGAAYVLARGTRLRLAAGTAFKEPTFYENFAAGYVRGNPDLRPERSASWEAGVEQSTAGGRATLQATWFDQRFRDLIQYLAQPPVPGQPNYFNLGAARAVGLEVAAGAEVGGALRLDASYTYLRTRVMREGAGGDPSFIVGQRLLRRPTHTFAFTGGWRPRRGTFLGATTTWVGSRDDLDFSDPSAWPAPRIVLPAYLRLDLAGERTILRARGARPALAATLHIENLLDRHYREIANFPARGRLVQVGARMNIGG